MSNRDILKARQTTGNYLKRLIATRMKRPDTSDDELTTLSALKFFAAKQMSLVDRVVSLEALFQIGHHSSLALFK